MSRIYIGACSWSDFEKLYPPDLPSNQQITYYAQRFPLVEIDSTFYRIMPARNFSLWVQRTPPGFVFDVKVFSQLTYHDREHAPTAEVAQQFSDSVQPLRGAGKLGALHFQFAPWVTYGADNLAYIRSLRALYPGDELAIELRHRSWYAAEAHAALVEALTAERMTLTVVDEPQVGSGSVPTLVEVTNPELATVRFHGRNTKTWYKKVARAAERFDYLYSTAELGGWVEQIKYLAELAKTVHVLFNNNIHDYAIDNGRELRHLLRERLLEDEVVASPEEEG
ncbi:MAG: DUF72 domain-containing protein [Anaerolineae bacterium]